MSEPTDSTAAPELSIVVPALNEQDSLAALVEQVRQGVLGAGIDAELIVVDDGSTDDTLPRLVSLARAHPWLRPLHHRHRLGQSAALLAGIQAARGRYIATLDADLQNDPADLPALLEPVRAGQADMVQGDRSECRQDHIVRRCSSWVGRVTRRLLLGDTIRDTGCSARVVTVAIARQYPLQFKGMHRFLPVYTRMLGAKVIELPVHHRRRATGRAKYGILNRGPSGLIDCLAVRWMLRRYRDPAVQALGAAEQDPT